MDLPERLAGQYLRMLQSRGLAGGRYEGRWVFYEAAANPTIPETELLLKALRKGLTHDDSPFHSTITTLTGFTHPRRIRLIAVLAEKGSLTFAELQEQTGISPRALVRHLDKLERRGLLRKVGKDTPSWCLRVPKEALGKTLIDCCSR